MFKVSYKDLRSDSFRMAMMKLATCSEYEDVKVAYNIARMSKALEEKLKSSQKEWLSLAAPLIEKDEKGNFKISADGPTFKEGVDKAQAEKSLQDFVDKEIIVERFKLKLEDIAPAKLSPADLAALEPLLAPQLEVAP